MVAPEDVEPQVDPEAPNGPSQDAAAPQAPDAEAPASDAEAPAPPAEASSAPADAFAGDGGTSGPVAAVTPAATGPGEPVTGDQAPASAGPDSPVEPVTPATTSVDDAVAPAGTATDGSAESAPSGDAAQGEDGSPEGGAAEGGQSADGGSEGDGSEGGGSEGGATTADGEPKKKRRRLRGKRSGRGGGPGGQGGPGGGRRRFAWDEVFLRQRLEILRAMDPDPAAIAWAVDTAGRFDVADILAGEGSSGREFGRRAYGATPETDDQAAWIVLAAVRARDIVSIARRAVSGVQDQREQVKAAIELLGIARVNTALQGDRPAQQVYAERARRVDVTVKGGEDQKAAWALLSLARPQDVVSATTPRRPAGGPGGPGGPGRGGPGGPGRGGPGGFGDRGGRRERREPPIPGGVFSVGESGIGGELGAKLRAALAAAEGTPAEDEAPAPADAEAPQPDAPQAEDVTTDAPAEEASPTDAPQADDAATDAPAEESSPADAPQADEAPTGDDAAESQDS